MDEIHKPQIFHFDILHGKIENHKTFRDIPYVIFHEYTIDEVSHNPHMHPQPEFWQILSGNAKITLNENAYAVKTGDIVFINSGVMHCIGESTNFSYFSLIVDDSFSKECGVTENMVFREVFRDSEITRCFTGLREETVFLEDFFELKIKIHMMNAFASLLRRNLLYSDNNTKVSVINDIIDYIRENYQAKLSLEKVAREHHISKCHMCAIFKEATGNTLLSYINSLRCIHANHLLHTTDMPHSEIAKICGFSSSTYFARVFKKYYGYPPSGAKKERELSKS